MAVRNGGVKLLAGERQERESPAAVQACNDYLRLVGKRSLEKVAGYSISQLRKWSARFGWVARAEMFDAAIDEEKTRRAAERRQKAMEEGLALDYERVLKLRKLAERLWDELKDEEKLWLKDYKFSRMGDEREIERFNGSLVEQFRGTLDDLAKETGGRKHKTEISGPDGGEVVLRVIYDTGNSTTTENDDKSDA